MNVYTLLLIVFSHVSSSLSDPYHCSASRCSVTSPSGSYHGLRNSSILMPNCHYCSYTDIPYAVAPRFGKPIPLERLGSFVINATQDNVKCAQPQTGQNMSLEGTENCLYLNVFVPQTNEGMTTHRQPPKAVIVFIHGGLYWIGSKSSAEFYAPDYFMTQDIVLVVINYRLGAFGFLNLGIPECGGNMGLRDQIEALKWVRQNIASFGGDPGRVTVMGESSGAISAYLLALSPQSQSLITTGIIAQSPVYTDRIEYDIMLRRTTEYYSILFAIFLGYTGDSNNRYGILHFFQKLTTLKLVKGYTQFIDYLVKTSDIIYSDLPFVASVDHNIPDALFPGTLEELGQSVSDIPIIYGVNNADGDYNTFADPPTVADYILSHIGLYLWGSNPIYAKNTRTLLKAITKVKEYYNPSGRDNKINVSVKIETYFDYDNLYTKQLPVFRASYYNNKIWLYEFRYESGYQDFKALLLGQYAVNVTGASHAQELEYLFFEPVFFPNGSLTVTRDELSLIHRMTSWWANFAKTGDPNRGNSNNRCTNVVWGPTNPACDSYLQIGVGNTSQAAFVRHQKIFQKQRDFFQRLLEFARNN